MKYPKDWEEKNLLDCVSLVQGLTYKPDNVKKFGTLVLRSSNIQSNRLSLDDNLFVDSVIPVEKMVQPNDILICVRNGSAALIGKSCVLPQMPNTSFGAFMAILRGDKTGYISHIFQSGIVQEQIRNRSSATINQITKKDFEKIVIPFPPLMEQHAIAKNISDFDTHINNLSALIEKKKMIRDGVLEDLVTGKTRLTGFNERWVKIPLKNIATIIMGQSPNSRFYNTKRKGLPLIQGNADIKNRKAIIRFYTEQITKIAIKGDIIMTVRAPVGNIAKTSFDCCLGRGVCALHDTTDFLYYALIFIEDKWDTLSTGTTFDSINTDTLGKIILNIPQDRREQKAIASILAQMDDEIETIEVEKAKMMDIREGIMDDLLTGRVRLKI